MNVESVETPAASWTGTIIKGKQFRKLFKFAEKASGNPTGFSNFQIDITPNTGEPFSWTIENGKIARQDAGVYLLDVSGDDTATFEWASARYCFNGTELLTGDVNPCFLTGLLFVEG